jgi:hypothetical protein
MITSIGNKSIWTLDDWKRAYEKNSVTGLTTAFKVRLGSNTESYSFLSKDF